MANVIGPDVSFYQDDPETPQGIDFVKMKLSAEYVIVRAGQNLWVDSDFKVNWREAKLAGLPRGSYWFYDSRVEPKRQAELWVQQFDGDFGELPLFADFEETYNGAYKGWEHWYTFLEQLKALVNGKEIAIYTGYYYWRNNAPNEATQAGSLEYFHQYPLWIANYDINQPFIPKPWSANEWLFWQYTDMGDGKLYGVESNGVDLNYFNGDLAAFKTRFKLGDTTSPPSDDPDQGTPTGKMYRVTANPSLKVREGPGVTYNSIGLLYPNEIVEEIDANSDRTWLRTRKSDGSLKGWSFALYLQSVVAAPPSNKKYRVTANPSLKVRQGPGLTYTSIGLVPLNTIVEEIDANADGTWLKIRTSDGSLVGWSSSAYLELSNSVVLPVENKKYRVTSTTLPVLDAPNSVNPLSGLLYFGEIVEELDSNSDRTWVNINKLDGSLTGWCLVENLISADAPITDDTPIPDPIPTDADKKWYRVGVASLTVRETASASGKALGIVLLDDTLPVIDETNPNWTQIRRVDGLLGWCEKKNLVFVSNTRPASIRQNIVKGVTYLQKDLTTPRKNKMHVMAVDLATIGLEFLVTPSTDSNGVLCTRTTSKFIEDFSLSFAVNGDGFSYLGVSVNSANTCSNGGYPVKANGFAASRGKIYSPIKTVQPIVYISKRNQVTINDNQNQQFNAISGDRLIVNKGARIKNLAATTPNPRTGIGVSRNGRWLIFMVVDGRQTDYSEGVTFPELADLLISYGVYTGVNMDGGGSSAMVIKGFDGKARLLNSPIDQNIKGKERAVANHLGLYIKK